MATTKITAEMLKKLVKFGLKGADVKDADAAKKALIKLLAKKEVDDVENETLEELVEMYDAFFEEPEAEEEEEEEEEEEQEETEEEETDRLSAEEEEEEEEEEEPQPKKSTKPAPAPAKKPVAAAKPAPAVKKPAPAKKEAAVKYLPWNNEDKKDRKALQPILDLFPDAEVRWLKQGITLFFVGKSSKKAIISYDRVRNNPEGGVIGDIFFNALKGKEEVIEHVGDGHEYKRFNANLWFISKQDVDSVVEILETEDLIKTMMKRLTDADKRAVQNREKLEEKMASEKQSKPAAKPAEKVSAKAKAVVEPDEEEEEEVVTKSSKKTVAVPKPSKASKGSDEEEEEEEIPVKKAVKPVAKKK